MPNETKFTPGIWTPARILHLAEASEVEFAVRACNAHCALVSALVWMRDNPKGHPENRRRIVEDALAKAGEA